MNIIDKLGICGGLTIEKHGFEEILYSGRDNLHHGLNLVYFKSPAFNFSAETKLCITAAPEMLEALIELYDDWKHIDYIDPDIAIKPKIEKATGKTWEEIKDLL